jgi:hypothetical protein
MRSEVPSTPTAYAGKAGSFGRTITLVTLAVIVLAAPVSSYAQGYGGPSLLSRGGNRAGQRGRAPTNIRIYGAVRGTYESGLIAPALDETGQLKGVSVTGTQVEGGAYGARSWRRSSIGLDYRGDYRKTNPALFNGSNQALSLDWQYQPSRRITLFAQETAGTTNRAFGGFSAPAFADQDNFGVPLNEVFDSRVYFSQTSAGVSYRQSARVSLKFTADGFLVRRTNRALIGMQGYRTGVEWSRQMSRSFATGVAYNYLKFEYPRVYGGSNIHMVGAVFRKSFTRSLDLSGNLGVFRAITTGTESFTLSPEVAAVLGRSRGVQAFKRAFIAPQVRLALDLYARTLPDHR